MTTDGQQTDKSILVTEILGRIFTGGRNLEGYLARYSIFIGIDVKFPSTELPLNFEPGCEPKPLEEGTCGRQADFEAKNTKVARVHWSNRTTQNLYLVIH
jgi:hypothetical protein